MKTDFRIYLSFILIFIVSSATTCDDEDYENRGNCVNPLLEISDFKITPFDNAGANPEEVNPGGYITKEALMLQLQFDYNLKEAIEGSDKESDCRLLEDELSLVVVTTKTKLNDKVDAGVDITPYWFDKRGRKLDNFTITIVDDYYLKSPIIFDALLVGLIPNAGLHEFEVKLTFRSETEIIKTIKLQLR